MVCKYGLNLRFVLDNKSPTNTRFFAKFPRNFTKNIVFGVDSLLSSHYADEHLLACILLNSFESGKSFFQIYNVWEEFINWGIAHIIANR